MAEALRAFAARFACHRLAVAAAGTLALLVLFGLVGPLLWPYDHTIHTRIVRDSPPSLAHPFGTSRTGYDLLGQAMRGTLQSLRVALVAGALAAVIGTVWGAVAGYFRGWLDGVLMRTVDALLTVPLLVIVLVLAGGSDSTSWLDVGLAIGLFGWVGTARVVRGVVVSLREHDFIDAARALGASDARILARHVFPNVAGTAVVAGTLTMAAAILVEAAMSFVGFGIDAPDTSLGLLVSTSQGAAFTRPWLFFVPGALLTVMGLAVSLVGDGLRDAFDARR